MCVFKVAGAQRAMTASADALMSAASNSDDESEIFTCFHSSKVLPIFTSYSWGRFDLNHLDLPKSSLEQAGAHGR